jgi:hypothetical protein
MATVLGMTPPEVEEAIGKYNIERGKLPARKAGQPLFMLPYPGGRHPRIGFLEGAINPMRGTKFSVFLPWEKSGYIVADLPEAVWANNELIFLAHTHVETKWDRQGVKLQNIDWDRKEDGVLREKRRLPDGVVIEAQARASTDSIAMDLKIQNGSDQLLKGMRAQVCIMLKGAPEFSALTGDNKVLLEHGALVRADSANRWIGTVWENGRPWQNPDVPCLHSDPAFPDCAPGESVSARGWIVFGSETEVRSAMAEFDKKLHKGE